MSLRPPLFRSHITLALLTVLHAFTHAYAVMLVPLYLLVRDDLGLKLVSRVSLIVTLYGLVYCLGSYGAGVLADRFNRKALLGIGLIGNALAILAMGLTRQYEMLIVLGMIAGAFGTLFHPAANALAPAHYPNSPGMAIGLLGMGSGLGFFAGPQFAGWRAQSATWDWGMIADWQKPCVELGVIGVVMGVLFLIFANDPRPRSRAESTRRLRLSANDAPDRSTRDTRAQPDTRVQSDTRTQPDVEAHPPLGAILRWRVVPIALVLALRDFSGIASHTLVSLYLQKVWGYDVKRAGFTLGAMMLLGIFANPIAVWLTPGRRRLPGFGGLVLVGACFIIAVPFCGRGAILPLMGAFQAFALGSYAVSDAAMLERVPAAVRGRVVGLFLTIAGTFAAMSPFVMGYWIDQLGDRAILQQAYIAPFVTLGVLLALSAFAAPLIAKLGAVQGPRIEPISETMPGTVEVLG